MHGDGSYRRDSERVLAGLGPHAERGAGIRLVAGLQVVALQHLRAQKHIAHPRQANQRRGRRRLAGVGR
eukprot:39045-Rhodomonas_salina.2